MNCFRS